MGKAGREVGIINSGFYSPELISWNMKNIFAFSIISRHLDDKGIYNLSLWKTRTHLFCITKNMVVNDLAMQGARSLAVLVLTEIFPEYSIFSLWRVNMLRLKHKGQFVDDIFKCISYFAKLYILTKISLGIVLGGNWQQVSTGSGAPVMVWCWTSGNPLPEPLRA